MDLFQVPIGLPIDTRNGLPTVDSKLKLSFNSTNEGSAEGRAPQLKGNLKHSHVHDVSFPSTEKPRAPPKRISFEVNRSRETFGPITFYSNTQIRNGSLVNGGEEDNPIIPKSSKTGGKKKKKKSGSSSSPTATRTKLFSGTTKRIISSLSTAIASPVASNGFKPGSHLLAPTKASLLKAKPALVKNHTSNGAVSKNFNNAKNGQPGSRAVTSMAKPIERNEPNQIRFKSAPSELMTVGKNKLKKRRSSKKLNKMPEPEPEPEPIDTPGTTAMSIELTPGLAETSIPKKLSVPKFMPPPQPDFQICTAFPGTPEWDKYWMDFNASMKKYSKDMAEYDEGMAAFSEDLNRYRKAANTVSVEQQILNSKDGYKLGLELGIVPPLTNYKLEGIHVVNGYIVKGKGFQGTVSSIPGQPKGIRIEVNTRGIDPDTILIQREFNMLTMSASVNQFLRIGCPDGVLATDIENWPVIDGIYILDGP